MSSAISKEYIDQYLITQYSNYNFTPEGAYYYSFANGTGAVSVKGTLVYYGVYESLEKAFYNNTYNRKIFGVIYENGIAQSAPVKACAFGKMQVLLENNASVTSGQKLIISTTTSGRAVGTTDSYDSNSINYVGIALETVTGGTDKLVLAYVPMK